MMFGSYFGGGGGSGGLFNNPQVMQALRHLGLGNGQPNNAGPPQQGQMPGNMQVPPGYGQPNNVGQPQPGNMQIPPGLGMPGNMQMPPGLQPRPGYGPPGFANATLAQQPQPGNLQQPSGHPGVMGYISAALGQQPPNVAPRPQGLFGMFR